MGRKESNQTNKTILHSKILLNWTYEVIQGSQRNCGIILPAKSRSDVMFYLQSYGTYLSWQD